MPILFHTLLDIWALVYFSLEYRVGKSESESFMVVSRQDLGMVGPDTSLYSTACLSFEKILHNLDLV